MEDQGNNNQPTVPIPKVVADHFRDEELTEAMSEWIEGLQAVEAVNTLVRSKGDFWSVVGQLLTLAGKIQGMHKMKVAFQNIHEEVTKPEGRHNEES